MNHVESIQQLGCWFYMGFWVVIYNRRNWWLKIYIKTSEGASFRLNKYMSRTRVEVILPSIFYTNI